MDQLIEVGGDQRALADGAAARRRDPILLQGEQQLPAVQPLHGGLQRERQLHRPVRGQHIGLGFEEAERAGDQRHPAPGLGVEQAGRRDLHVLGHTAEHLLGRLERLAALQQLDHEGIAGLGHGAGAPLAADRQGVLVQPGHVLLAARQEETALDEAGRGQVELARLDGVLAAVGQGNQAEPLLGLEAAGPLPDPGLALRLGEGVQVEHGLPLGIRGLVALQRRAPPQALGVRLVLPEIVDRPGADARHRDPVGGVDDLQRFLVQRGVAGIGFQQAKAPLVLGLRPFEGAGAVGLLQPDEGIGGVGGGWGHGSRGRGLGEGQRRADEGGQEREGQEAHELV